MKLWNKRLISRKRILFHARQRTRKSCRTKYKRKHQREKPEDTKFVFSPFVVLFTRNRMFVCLVASDIKESLTIASPRGSASSLVDTRTYTKDLMRCKAVSCSSLSLLQRVLQYSMQIKPLALMGSLECNYNFASDKLRLKGKQDGVKRYYQKGSIRKH